MNEPLNPVQIEATIRALSNDISNSVRIVSNAHAAQVKAQREYERAYARAYLAAEGTVQARRLTAELATADELDVLDVAREAHRYADRQARALESSLRAYQSIGASVRAMYSAPQGLGR